MNIDVGNTPLPLLGPVLLRAILDHGCSDHSRVHRGITERQDRCVPPAQHGIAVRQDLCAPQAKDDSDADNDEFEVEPTVRFANPLRPQPVDVRAEENKTAIGGMRHPKRAVSRLGLRSWGRQVRRIFDDYLRTQPHLVKT